MRTLEGSAWGLDQPMDAVTIDTIGTSNYIRVRTGTWLNIFNRAAIIEGDITNDTLGLYSQLIVDGEGKAKFGTIKTPRHLFRPRQNGCVWTPNGKIRMGLTEFDTCPIEYQGEQCPDAFWNSCYESLFEPGRGVRDLESGDIAQITAATMRQLAIGLGNSFFSLWNFANHPDITTADTNGTYLVDDDEWDDYYAQQVGSTSRPVNCSGMVTILDELANAGEPGYTVDIPNSDITAGAYTGDVIALFNQMVNAAKPELKTAARRGVGQGAGRRYPIMLVTENIYQAYQDYLITTFPQIPTVLQYVLQGVSGGVSMVPGVLNWNGIPVVSWDAVTSFDEIVGTTSTKIALVAPGAFGVASDVRSLRQYQGMGLIAVQKLDPPYNGKIYMDTTLRWGAALADPDYVVYGRNA